MPKVLAAAAIVQFANPSFLQRLDGSAFDASGQPPQTIEEPDIRQGFVETSNVDTISAMTDMIEHTRLFESQQKALRTTDDILARSVRDLGKF